MAEKRAEDTAEPPTDEAGHDSGATEAPRVTTAHAVEQFREVATSIPDERYRERIAAVTEQVELAAEWPLETSEIRNRQSIPAEHQREADTRSAVHRRWFESDPDAAIEVESKDGHDVVTLTVDAGARELSPPSMAAEGLEGDVEGQEELLGDGVHLAHLDVNFVPGKFTQGVRRREGVAREAVRTHTANRTTNRTGAATVEPATAEVQDGTTAGPDVDEPGAVFGADDRTAFRDTSFPWSTVGRVETASGYCSGTMIGERLLLTATHCIDWSGGDPGWLKFTPAAYDGTAPFGEAWAERVIYWNSAPGSTLTDTETAFDYAVCVLDRDIGNATGYVGYRTYSWWWNGGDYWQHVGYPGAIASGRRPVFVDDATIHAAGPRFMDGQVGYVLGTFMDYTDGQSGGPVWGWWDDEPWPRVVGVMSTLGGTPPTRSLAGDNEAGGGPALSALISYARSNY